MKVLALISVAAVLCACSSREGTWIGKNADVVIDSEAGGEGSKAGR